MGTISADVDPGSIRSTGLEQKCGTCRSFVVRPNEMELAKYALSIGACAPGVHCLGGAVRGLCIALEGHPMVESTDMGTRTRCGGRLYRPGGPTMRGMEGSASRWKPELKKVAADTAAEAESIHPLWTTAAGVVLSVIVGKVVRHFGR